MYYFITNTVLFYNKYCIKFHSNEINKRVFDWLIMYYNPYTGMFIW